MSLRFPALAAGCFLSQLPEQKEAEKEKARRELMTEEDRRKRKSNRPDGIEQREERAATCDKPTRARNSQRTDPVRAEKSPSVVSWTR